MLDRRTLLNRLAIAGIGTPVLHRAIASLSAGKMKLDIETLRQAQWISGNEMTDEELEDIVGIVNRTSSGLESLRKVPISDDVPMAIHFSTLHQPAECDSLTRKCNSTEVEFETVPATDTEIAFLPVSQLSQLVKKQKITSERLTDIYLARLKKFSPMLRCVVTLTEDLARQQSRQADQEIKAGKYRGPLHGIPWGAKDLIAVPGYPTSWGIPHYQDRIIDSSATVGQRLEDAGAVLVAKLSLGALANGDKWFGGMTRSPWYPKIGSSGSSAGSASAAVAGLVGFALGSETLGSIVSPSIRCGASALRPTFGRVSRHGCMPLSWSLDKIGPICRSVEDCALVFNAIHGSDGIDPTAGNYEFKWPSDVDLGSLKIGYATSRRSQVKDRKELQIIKRLGCQLVEFEMPTKIPARALMTIIDVEAATVFDDLLRAGQTEGWNRWPGDFRAAQFVSAVDYVRIQRARTILMEQFEQALSAVDAIVNVDDLVQSNFTGHPTVVFPIEYRERGEAKFPRPVKFTGRLYDDERLLKICHAFQGEIDAHSQHPQLDTWLPRFQDGTLDDTSGQPNNDQPSPEPAGG